MKPESRAFLYAAGISTMFFVLSRAALLVDDWPAVMMSFVFQTVFFAMTIFYGKKILFPR